MATEKKNWLTLWIFLSIVAAVVVALLFPHQAVHLEVGGEIFLRLLKMVVVPLVISSVMSSIIGLGDVRKLGKPGGVTIAFYIATTLIAVITGLIVVNVIQPGDGMFTAEELEARRQTVEVVGGQDRTVGAIVRNLVLMLFTDNLVASAAKMDLLPLIGFSILFAATLTVLGRRASLLSDVIVQVNEALLAFVMVLMRVAPLGIFCLVAARFGAAQADGRFMTEMAKIAWYFNSVLVGLGIHALITLPAIYWIVRRQNPFRFYWQMSQAALTAFSTASSSATLPVTIECATVQAKVSKQSADFVIPLGSTINMDGTALYEATAAMFIAQAIGVELDITQQIVVALTATLAAIGAAGIPEAGLFTMLIVLNAVGLPQEYIGLILSVDWLLDRFRTTVNVMGDAVGAAVVQGVFPKPNEPMPDGPPPLAA